MLSICLWEQRESNPRPSACKADALNQLSYAPIFQCAIMANCCVICGIVTQSRNKVRSFTPNLDALHLAILPHFKFISPFIFSAIIASYFAHRSVMYSCTLLSSSSYSLFLPKINFERFIFLKELPLLGLQMYAIFSILQKIFHATEYTSLVGRFYS